MMTTNYLLVPAVNPNLAKVPITNITASKPTRFRPYPRRSYTSYERKLLFQLVKQYKSVGDTKDPLNPTSKYLPWHIIAEEFNAREGTEAASATQLSNLYRNVTRKELKREKELRMNQIIGSLKVELEEGEEFKEESDQTDMADEVWADESGKPASSDEEVESVLGLESDLFTNDSEKNSTSENTPSQSDCPSTSKSNLMHVSSKAAEAFVELLNVAEPVSEHNVLLLKQKEEEHRVKMSHLNEEHKMKMMVYQAKLDYYRALRLKVSNLKVSKSER